MAVSARAFWLREPGHGELRTVEVEDPGPDDVLVRGVCSGVSRGTELLVYRGGVPAAQAGEMRAPFQEGDFPAPVKYGYLNVGRVELGPTDLLGRTVFCLHPHQTVYVVPSSAVVVVPEGVPAARAVLAGTVETAVNALWDAPPRIGERITVVGGGVLGLLLAWLAARVPGTTVQVVDALAARAEVAARLGASFALPDAAAPDAERVFHASGSGAGLATALRLAAFEATVVELSWYGNRAVVLPLGEDFHARRLRLQSSQVGHVASAMRSRWTRAQRLALALSLLNEPVLDALITDAAAFDALPEVLKRSSLPASEAPHMLCQRIDYDAAL